jgi:orotate phosphoribosyltransferase
MRPSSELDNLSLGELKEHLRQLINRKAVLKGTFTLASGDTSSYYINMKKVTFSAEGSYTLAKYIFELIKDTQVETIGGLEIGSIPISSAVSSLSWAKGRPIDSFCVRKQAKGHGTKDRVGGFLESGQNVIVLDDVVTRGNSTLEAVKQVQNAGAKILHIISIVDREAGARELFAQEGLVYQPIFSKDDLDIT